MKPLAAALVACIAVSTLSAQIDIAELTDGVKSITAPGSPGSVAVWNDKGSAVVLGRSGENSVPVVVAAPAGAGRAAIFGHSGYLAPGALTSLDTGKFLINVVKWCGKKPVKGSGAPIVAVRHNAALAKWLSEQKVQTTVIDDGEWTKKLAGFGVLVWNPDRASDAEMEAVRAYIAGGGGFVGSATGWGWRQLNQNREIRTYEGNRLLAPFGLGWCDGGADKTAKDGFAVSATIEPLTNAATALLAVETAGENPLDQKAAGQITQTVLAAAIAATPDDLLIMPRLTALAAKTSAVPTPKAPIKKSAVLERLAMRLSTEAGWASPPEKTPAHPAAVHFPGALPADAQPVQKTIAMDSAQRGWKSTGLYAAPGRMVEVSFERGLVDVGVEIRIGAHRDHLWDKDEWRRCPEITRSWAVDDEAMKVASPFGGPIYIELPQKSRKPLPETFSVAFSGAFAAPLFVRGKTSLDDWKTKERANPAPWAELVGNGVALTVPSRVVRSLDDPEAVMKFWDAYADACADLSARSRFRLVPERYCLDEQISAGYMHSGYPIMTHLDVAEVIVDVARLKKGDGVWGFFHEMGHNHQVSDWTFEGTGEVTCNVFALYGLETLCGVKDAGHDAVEPAAIKKKMERYFAQPASLERWREDPFVALIMYNQLRTAFGWEPFRKVFGEYRTLERDQRPKTDDDRRDQWMMRMSKAVGKNLGPFFTAWGVTTSEAARKEVATLAEWMPDGMK